MNPAYFATLAAYNGWANKRLYDACKGLSDNDYRRDGGAFFGSVHRTLNHILVGDRIWLARLTDEPSGIEALDQVLFDDFETLRAARREEDAKLSDWVGQLTDDKLAEMLEYADIAGTPRRTPVGIVLGHLFNHQTHHRGQVHALFSGLGIDPPELDLIFYSREMA